MSDVPYSWEKSYRDAVAEGDPAQLHGRVMDAEGEIFVRLQELAASSDHHQEREAMSAATEQLLRIKTEKLKWPHPAALPLRGKVQE